MYVLFGVHLRTKNHSRCIIDVKLVNNDYFFVVVTGDCVYVTINYACCIYMYFVCLYSSQPYYTKPIP